MSYYKNFYDKNGLNNINISQKNKQEEISKNNITNLIEKTNNNKKKLLETIDIITQKINENNNQINNDLQEILLEINNYKIKIESLEKENNELKLKLINCEKENKNSKTILEYKNIKALKIHQNIFEYNKYVENLYKVNKWEIKSETYETRAEILSKYPYWDELKNEFNNKKLTDKYLTNSQLVSYFDTMYLMYQLLNDITSENIKKEMKIIQEYRIDMPNKPRIDYLLVYRNDMILLEFGKSTIKDLGKDLTEKQRQLEGYEKSLKNSLEDKEKYTLTSIPVVYLSEETDKNKEHNNDSLRSALKQINRALKNQRDAFEQLQNIE